MPKFKFLKKKVITRLTNGDKTPYMIRWNLFQCPWFSIKLHKILLSDDACLHDHPWSFISFILKGGYVEQSSGYVKKLYGAGSILYRPAHYAHRLDIFQPAYTLVITFKKTREWGFYTPDGWVRHYEYSQSNRCE